MFWIHVEPIEVFDANGKQITILSYLGHGSYDDTATLTITGDPGPNPPPPPPPPPPPLGPWQIMMYFDGGRLDNLPPSQRDLLISLTLRQRLVAADHVFLEVLEAESFAGSVPEKYKPWVDTVRGDPMPRIAIAPKEGGTIRDYDLPEDEAGLIKLLEAAP